MLPYTIGKFSVLFEDASIAHLITDKKTHKRLARFAQKYYLYSQFKEIPVSLYLRNFLKNSQLPFEVKRRIGVIVGVEDVKNLAKYQIITEDAPLEPMFTNEVTAAKFLEFIRNGDFDNIPLD